MNSHQASSALFFSFILFEQKKQQQLFSVHERSTIDEVSLFLCMR